MNYTGKSANKSADDYSNIKNSATLESVAIINCALNVPLMLICITGNALVLATILRTPSIHSTSMIMLSSLAVSDLLVGAIVQPFFIFVELKQPVRYTYSLPEVIGYAVCGVSLGTITAVSVDRFLALHYHVRYATLVTKSRVRYVVASIWVASALLSGLYFWNDLMYSFFAAAITAICLVLSAFSYIRIYRIVRKHQLQLNAQQRAVESLNAAGNKTNASMVRNAKSALNTFVFDICMIICYSPMYILLILDACYIAKWKTEWNFATTLVFKNSSMNPILYCWRLHELRTAVLKTAKQVLNLCRQANLN